MVTWRRVVGCHSLAVTASLLGICGMRWVDGLSCLMETGPEEKRAEHQLLEGYFRSLGHSKEHGIKKRRALAQPVGRFGEWYIDRSGH